LGIRNWDTELVEVSRGRGVEVTGCFDTLNNHGHRACRGDMLREPRQRYSTTVAIG